MVKLILKFHSNSKRQDQMIQQAVSNAAKTMDISVGELLLNPEEAHKTIKSFLCDRCSLSEDKAWNISCYFNEGLGSILLDHLNNIFANDSLGISVKLQPNLGRPSICLTEENKTAKLRFDAVFSICDKNTRYGSIKASMTLIDFQLKQAQFEYSLV
jgi:hypothetical protein